MDVFCVLPGTRRSFYLCSITHDVRRVAAGSTHSPHHNKVVAGTPLEGFSSIWEDEKGIPSRISLCVLPGTRTLDPLIKSQLLYQLS